MKRFLPPAKSVCLLCNRTGTLNFSSHCTASLKQANSTLYPLMYNFKPLGDTVAGTTQCLPDAFQINYTPLVFAGLRYAVVVNGSTCTQLF